MRWLAAVLCGGALACGESAGPHPTSGPVRVDPAASSYEPGATVDLTITNLSPEMLSYTPCFYRLERQGRGGGWQVIYQDQNPCPAVLEYLEPFASRQASVILPDGLGLGPHRARFPSIGATRGDQEAFIPAAQVGDSFDIRP
jgi:hypothetical protein